VLAAFARDGGPLFRKTSCAVSYAHELPDYNGHYGISSNSSDTQWTRLAYVFGSVEAIAFAAAGALFGVTVQRDRVEKAEQKADKNAQDAANGKALAAINLADEGQVVERDGKSVSRVMVRPTPRIPRFDGDTPLPRAGSFLTSRAWRNAFFGGRLMHRRGYRHHRTTSKAASAIWTTDRAPL